MNEAAFIEILKAYELPTENMYEDLSALGLNLWHNDRLGLSVEWAYDKQPSLRIVIVRSTDNYSYLECNLKEFDNLTLARVIEYVKDQNGTLYKAALMAHDTLTIPIDGRDWCFKVVPG